MSNNIIKICGFCLKSSIQDGVKFSSMRAKYICAFYRFDDCCNDCVFSKSNQYEKDKKEQIKANKIKNDPHRKAEIRKSNLIYTMNVIYDGGNGNN